jgi:mono/diheme cytochrome c family protein
MGMKINGDNAAYYVATYASLTDAEARKELKYIDCKEYSPHPTLAATVGYIKFYAYDKDGNRTGVVPDEDRHRSTYVPYVCMACHGGGTFTIAATFKETAGAESVKTRKGDVDGQFVAFDTANYTFGQADGFQRKDLFQKKVFTSLNQGLLKSAGIMPDNLTKLINALVAGDKNYTTAPPAGWEADAASVDLYNKLYAVSCRSCHVTQGDKNWSKAAKFKSDRSQYATVPSFTKKGKGLMPQAQRAHSIFWGSATGNKINATIFSQPQALSGAAPAFVP